MSQIPHCVEADEADFVNCKYGNTVEIPGYGVLFGNYQTASET
ncbi:MAG: hypothetical protein SAJ12_07730 [Jaaginema sp. PMC 1079.18]|nr:hypothetical protein [Jaaginema sp. PMC 1080.18]MEC4850888.1 hypothetical protein [Jaaginema sp. PMC 1079.18]MEC4867583.1 hypothetical protein [Jaaginema sp. PMC 1078.18]